MRERIFPRHGAWTRTISDHDLAPVEPPRIRSSLRCAPLFVQCYLCASGFLLYCMSWCLLFGAFLNNSTKHICNPTFDSVVVCIHYHYPMHSVFFSLSVFCGTDRTHVIWVLHQFRVPTTSVNAKASWFQCCRLYGSDRPTVNSFKSSKSHTAFAL
jgi:hypothetical protein